MRARILTQTQPDCSHRRITSRKPWSWVLLAWGIGEVGCYHPKFRAEDNQSSESTFETSTTSTNASVSSSSTIELTTAVTTTIDLTTGMNMTTGTGTNTDTMTTTSSETITNGTMISTTSETTTGGAELTCDYYCETYFAGCNNFSEYANTDACIKQCAQWPEGTINDVVGDSLGCRIYHAAVANSTDPQVHCPHAGPSGGGVNADPVCVDKDAPTCEQYCTEYFTYCANELNDYTDNKDCMGQCSAWYAGAQNDVDGDTIGCRTYHAGAAVGDPDLHCPHAGPSGGGVCVP